MILFIVLTFLLLLLGALLSAIETSLTAAIPSKLQKFSSNNRKKLDIIYRLLKEKSQIISSILILYSLTNILATTFVTIFFIKKLGNDLGPVISSVVMSVLVIIFSEIIPKAIAVANAEVILIKFRHFVNILFNVFKPINVFLYFITKIFCKIFYISLEQKLVDQEELRDMIEHQHVEGHVVKEDKDMLGGILDIRNMQVDTIMIHRSQIASIDIALFIKEIVKQAINYPYSKIPMWSKNKDNIVGILNVRELIKCLCNNDFKYTKLNLSDFIARPLFIPNTTLVNNQLQAFRENKQHFAIVVDEYGDLKGMLTLEDILEEIVGPIEDENDIENRNIIRKTDNICFIEGITDIRDINRQLSWNLPEDSKTIAGLVIKTIKYIPVQGEQILIDNFKITINQVIAHRIKNVIIEILPKIDSVNN